MLELDLREMEPPQPMIEIMAALEGMAPGAELVALLPRKPVYLLPHLEGKVRSYTLEEKAEDCWELRLIKG
ncbi:MAG: DUF2249 domain-containing protein [bacterium]